MVIRTWGYRPHETPVCTHEAREGFGMFLEQNHCCCSAAARAALPREQSRMPRAPLLKLPRAICIWIMRSRKSNIYKIIVNSLLCASDENFDGASGNSDLGGVWRCLATHRCGPAISAGTHKQLDFTGEVCK